MTKSGGAQPSTSSYGVGRMSKNLLQVPNKGLRPDDDDSGSDEEEGASFLGSSGCNYNGGGTPSGCGLSARGLLASSVSISATPSPSTTTTTTTIGGMNSNEEYATCLEGVHVTSL